MTLQEVLAADLAGIMAGGFAVTAIHTYGGGSDQENLDVLFQLSPELSMEAQGGGITTALPSVYVLTAAAGNIDRNSLFVIDSREYSVLEIQESVEGLTRILLSEDEEG